MDVTAWLEARRAELEQDLFGLLEIPSVSRDPARAGEVARCAGAVAALLGRAGMEEVRVVPTAGHPVVLARSAPRPGRPTVLVYGHYDVQPEGPEEEWTTPPFRPTVREGRVFARGASDDKGQVLAHVQAARALHEGEGGPPVNLKFLVEGDEETGSRPLGALLRSHRADLEADVVVVSDSAMFGPGVPSVVYALRGVAALEVVLRGPDAGLRMARLAASLLDGQGRVAVPGFYDRVRPLPPEEREALAALGDDEEALRREVGARGLSGEAGYTALERRTARPTLDVNGLQAGPRRAMVKLTCRLVPDQDPQEAVTLLRRRVLELCPDALVKGTAGGSPWITPPDHPALQAAARALRTAWGRPPVFQREGGTIPAVVHLQAALGTPMVLVGFGLASDGAHAPDEHFSLEGYHRGIRASVELMRELGALDFRP